MKQDAGEPTPPAELSKPGHEGAQYLSTRGLFIVFGTLAVALVLGYLLLSKLIAISQEEDCALAGRYNCGAVDIQR